MEGVSILLYPWCGLISHHVGDVFPLVPPLSLSVWIISHVTPDLQSCTSCLGGSFVSFSTVCLSCSQSTAFLIGSCRYCSANTSVACMCFAFHMTSLPVFVTHTVYEHPLWSHLLGSTMTLCIHGPPIFYLTAAADNAEMTEGFFFLSVIVLIIFTLIGL